MILPPEPSDGGEGQRAGRTDQGGSIPPAYQECLAAWRTVVEDGVPELRREVRTGCAGEAALFTVAASHLLGTAGSPSQLQLMLNSSGSVELRLQDAEGESGTSSESAMAAYLLEGLAWARRCKRNRLRRAVRLLKAGLIRSPGRLSGEEFRAGLAERGWRLVEPENRKLGVQQGYIFVLPDLALFFSVEVAAFLGSNGNDVEFEVGVCRNVATVIVYSHRWMWPPVSLFSVLETVTRLADGRHGEPQDLSAEQPAD